MTREEATLRRKLREHEESLLAEARIALQRPAECRAWPVTIGDRLRAAAAAAHGSAQQGYDLAWELLADWQDDRCAICRLRSDVLGHDHETALIRGWLCIHCNLNEGHAGGDPRDVYVQYRRRNPATILGIRIRYYNKIYGWATPR